MTNDEFVNQVTAQLSHVLHGNLNASGLLALGIVELRTRLRDLNAMLPEDNNLIAGAMSEVLDAIEHCERITADQRGAFDYGMGQIRFAAKTNLERFVASQTKLEQHNLNDQAVRQQVLALTGGKCAYCATDLKNSGGEQDQFCIEHVVPVSKGGPNHITNYVPACRSCNNSKGDRHVLYFIQNSFVLRQRATP